MSIAFHAATEKETEKVADYYGLQLPRLGAEFYRELGAILDLLEPNPWMGLCIRVRIAACYCNASRLRSITKSQTTRSGSWPSRTNADFRDTGKAVNNKLNGRCSMHGSRYAVAMCFFAMLGITHAETSRAGCTEGCVFRPAISLGSQVKSEVVAIGDLNGDGRLDIVAVGETGSNTVYVFLQAVDSTFLPPAAYEHPGVMGNSIATGDFNGDGRTDVVFTTYTSIRVLFQDAQGGLSTYQDYPTGLSFKLRVGDFNNDQRSDIAAITDNYSGVTVFYQNGAGKLDAPVSYDAQLEA